MFQLLAGLLAFFYGLVPNYAVAIGLLTLTVMLVLSPLTIKSTRSMLAMQKLQPEMKRLQQKHKGDRQKLNEEMMALYKEHKVNPEAGCLPMLLQMPVFLVMYQVIRGLTHKSEGVPDPKYLDKGTPLYQDLVEGGGRMVSFGVDLARTSLEDHPSFAAAFPFFLIVALVVFVQYYQSKQMTKRNPQAALNPQMQMMTKVLPVFFGAISLSIDAGVNVYFLVSGLFRIAQQGAMYRFDPTLAAHVKERVKDADAVPKEPKAAKDPKAKVVDVKTKPMVAKGRGGPAKADGNGSRPKAKSAPAKPAKRKSNASRAKQKRRSKKGR